MTRPTDRFSALAGAAADNASDLAATTVDNASELAARAADKIGALFGGTEDGFTERMIGKAKSIDAKDFVPSRQTVAKTGAGMGVLLAGAAVIAAGAFALYYWRERKQEEAQFDLLAKDGDFELRRYKPYLVAESIQKGSRSEALDAGFRKISAYIFAKPEGRAKNEDDAEKIAMTVPVTTTSEDNRSWRVRFVTPRAQTRETLPQPATGVAIAEQGERHVAALRFAGLGTDDELVEAKKHELVAWVAERGFKPVGDVEYAFYNAPIVPGPLRRNEVWIAIKAP
jgi:hypothetical protein